MQEPEINEEEWKKELETLVAKNQKDVESSLKRIQELIKEIGSFNVISNISYLNIVRTADDYSDYEPDTLPIVAEYVALLCLKQPYFIGDLELVDPIKFHSSIREIQECGLSIVAKVPFIKSYFQTKDKGLNLESMDEIARNFEGEEYYVRNPAFDTHHWEILEGLFSKFDKEIRKFLGFSVEEAVDLCYSTGDLVMTKSREGVKQSFKHAEKQYYDLLRYKSDKIIPDNFYPEELLNELSKLSKREIKNHFNSGAELYAATMFGHFYSFTESELSNESDIELTSVHNFLSSLSIKFQEVEIDFWEPQAIHPLKEKPIITAEGRYIVPAFSLLDWSIDKLFENTLLNAPKKLPNRYTSVKHDYLIDKTIDAIKQIIPECQTFAECEYFFQGKNGESDGLILWDDCLFIIEAKGQRITDSAKRGGVGRVEKHLDEIFNKAYAQGTKTLEYINSAEEVELKPKNQKSFKIKSSDYRHKFLIISSFAQLGHIAPLIKKSNELKIFDGEHYPHVVSIYDILVLRDILDFPSLFPYYLQRRAKFFEVKKYRITGEVDLLGNFLNYGLYFEHLDPENKMDSIVLPQFLDEFNQYYFYLEGLTAKTYQKPSYKLERKMKRLIELIEKSEVRHKTSASIFLLDLSPSKQKEFIDRLEIIKKSVRKDKGLHDFSLVGKHEGKSWGITYMTHPNKQLLSEKLNMYCNYKTKQQGTDIWIGIADCGLKEYQIEEILVINGG